MKHYTKSIIAICVIIFSGCVHLPGNYYAPSASGGTFLPPIEPSCRIQLDWIRLSVGGATLDLNVVRGDDKAAIHLRTNKFNPHAPIIKINLAKVSIQDAIGNNIYFPINTEQIDFRLSPTKWHVEPLISANDEGYYLLTYSKISDISLEKFVLNLPDILVGERVSKLPQVVFEKKFGIACDSDK